MSLKYLLLLAISVKLIVSEEVKTANRSDFKKTLTKDCVNSYSTTCFKLDVVSWVDKLNEEDNYSVLPGISVVKEKDKPTTNTADIVSELARDFPNDPDARLDAFLLKKVSNYLSSHSVRLNLWDATSSVTSARGGGGGLGGGGGGGGKKGGGMEIILAAAAMMKGTLAAIAFGGIAAVAGKAIMTALISLLISAIIGLKGLTHHGGKTTYEVISKPVYSHSNTHSTSHEDHGHYGHSSYGRSLEFPLPAALQKEY